MPLADEITIPDYRPGAAADPRAVLWIASDEPPARAQAWPVLVPIPDGWHVVGAAEAQAILESKPTAGSFVLVGPPKSPEAEVAALSSSAPETDRRRQSRPPRPPRTPRTPRTPRKARTVRASRLFREPRFERRPRTPRKPRAPRKPRPPRQRRPKKYQTKQTPGTCKGPSCTCWTPAGCIAIPITEAKFFYPDRTCIKGPCYSYEACVNEKCAVNAACLAQSILQFWTRQFKAAVAYVEPVVTPAVAAVTTQAQRLFQIAGPAPAPTLGPSAPPGAITLGCPPGWFWTLGLTGCRCVEPGTPVQPATQAQVIACIGQAAWDALVAQGVQGETAF